MVIVEAAFEERTLVHMKASCRVKYTQVHSGMLFEQQATLRVADRVSK